MRQNDGACDVRAFHQQLLNDHAADRMSDQDGYCRAELPQEIPQGVGHLANLERPGAFNAALDQFLRAHVAATQVTA